METDIRSTCRINEEDNNALTPVDILENFMSAGFKMLAEATKKSNNLPYGKTRDLYESYPSFHAVVQKQTEYVLEVLSMMLRRANCSGCVKKQDDEEKFEMIIDANDTLLENVGIILDELSGIVRNPEASFVSQKQESVNSTWNKNKKLISKGTTQVLNKILTQAKNIEKPQLKFREKVDNSSDTPFEPKLKYKYHLLKPLACLLETSENGLCQFSHPYEFELEKFKPSKEQMTHQTPILYKSLEKTCLVLVNEPEDVTQMINDLEKYKEIAVDLEHHSYRSFQGFTCLLQISTRDTDYIVDALSLRSDLEILNKVFTNPLIIKVFHGADLDILWLQRDLGIYVVNMFDTHQAVKLLNFPNLSLAYLLSHYCNVDAQKQFQLADWRIRPLPEELKTYAREDTHYLLYIYDNLRNALIEKANSQTNLLESVISESTRICLKRYIKPLYRNDGYLDLYHRSKKLFDNRQKYALKQLFEWRDKIARDSDESYAYVFPDHMMLNVCEVLPREAQGILACCSPVPVPVRQNLLVLHQIILKARHEPLIKPVLEEERLYRYTASVNPFDNPLQCPHDLNHEGEFRDDLPMLLGESNDVKSDEQSNSNISCENFKPVINVFENESDPSEMEGLKTVLKNLIALTPYHRYKLSKKYLESVEEKTPNKNDSQKGQDMSSPTVKKKPDNKNSSITVGESLESLEKGSKDSELLAEKLLCKNNTSRNTKEKMSDTNKRQSHDEIKPAKKLRVDKSNVLINPYALKEEKPDKLPEKRKKRKIPSGKDREFQPFNFNSVDFKKYKSSEVTPPKTSQNKHKSKRKHGRKNFKISI